MIVVIIAHGALETVPNSVFVYSSGQKKFTFALRAMEFIIISVCVPFLFFKHCTKCWAVSS